MKTKTYLLCSVSFVMLVVVLIGCGSKGSPSATAEGTATSALVAAETQPPVNGGAESAPTSAPVATETQAPVDGASVQSPTLCSADEQVIVTCQIQDSEKILSVCASPDFGENTGYIQYR